MSNHKKDILSQIDKKAKKIRDKRVDASNNKTLEAAIFDFFKNIEQSKQIGGGIKYDRDMFLAARKSMVDRIKVFDKQVKVSIEFNVTAEKGETLNWQEQDVRGVTIWWSDKYIVKNNVDPSLYIDVSNMLFL